MQIKQLLLFICMNVYFLSYISSSCNRKGNSDVSAQCATFMKQRLYVKNTYQKQQEEFYLTLNRINVHIYHIM